MSEIVGEPMSIDDMQIGKDILALRQIAINIFEAFKNIRIQIRVPLFGERPRAKGTTRGDEKTLSDPELLKRSRYLLTQSKPDWTAYQRELASQVFGRYPDLQTAYDLSENFKEWYNSKSKNEHRLTNEKRLFEWYSKAEESEPEQF